MELSNKRKSGEKPPERNMNRLGMIAFFAVLMFITSGTALGQAAMGQPALGQSLHQSALDAGQLPKTTAFYLAWHGTPPAETRAANSLLALWDDPDLAPVRASMIEQMMQGSAESHKANPPLTAEEFSQYASLLDNEFVFGYLL